MRIHLLAGGSDLLVGDCFSISPRQSSKTLAVERENWIEFGAVTVGGRRVIRTDVHIVLCASLDPGSVILSCETLAFVGGYLSEIPIRIQIGYQKPLWAGG